MMLPCKHGNKTKGIYHNMPGIALLTAELLPSEEGLYSMKSVVSIGEDL